MAELRDVVEYICDKYPHKSELSKARLTKIIYLADWKAALDRQNQLTDISWQFNHFGPYVDDVIKTARDYPEFDVEQRINAYGNLKELIRLTMGRGYPSLTQGDKYILDFVMALTRPKNWDEFLNLVYSTYPIASQPRYSTLDLPALATEYRKVEDSLS
jgi:hypothetical protein